MIHHLKIWPEFYQRVLDGSKRFEVRRNDRHFQCGDVVVLNEYNPKYQNQGRLWGDQITTGIYTGRAIQATVGFVLSIDDDFAKEKRVVFTLLDLRDPEPEGLVDEKL